MADQDTVRVMRGVGDAAKRQSLASRLENLVARAEKASVSSKRVPGYSMIIRGEGGTVVEARDAQGDLVIGGAGEGGSGGGMAARRSAGGSRVPFGVEGAGGALPMHLGPRGGLRLPGLSKSVQEEFAEAQARLDRLAGALSKEPQYAQHEVVRSDQNGGAGGFNQYRNPVCERLASGTLVATCTGRETTTDEGVIDLLFLKSTDGGPTWTDPRVIVPASGGTAIDGTLYHHDETGRLFYFFLRRAADSGSFDYAAGNASAPAEPGYIYSGDEGETWSEEQDLSGLFPEGAHAVPGPGKGLLTQSGRIVVPYWGAWKGGFACFCLFSDDRGETWHKGEEVWASHDGNECSVVELSSGLLVMNSRHETRLGKKRLLAYSRDGGETWYKGRPVRGLASPSTQADTMQYSGSGYAEIARTLYASEIDHRQRINLSVALSYDGGKSYPIRKTIVPGKAQNSSLVRLSGGDIGLLWEAGTKPDTNLLRFARFNLAHLAD